MQTWLAYKREKKQTYKGPKSIKVCYKKLRKLSGGNAGVAQEIVEQSIGNNWSGLFPLKNPIQAATFEERQQQGTDFISETLTDGTKP